MIKQRSPNVQEEGQPWLPTDLLILSLIWCRHARTLYELQKETLLSAGALVPALARLKAKGLITSEKRGLRNRQQFLVTAKVPKRLPGEWNRSTEAHIWDCDAVLKLCKAAEAFDIQEALRYVATAIDVRARALMPHSNEDGQLIPPDLNPFSYLSYRTVARFYQVQAEISTLKALESALLTDA